MSAERKAIATLQTQKGKGIRLGGF
jgi:hypothetical protein